LFEWSQLNAHTDFSKRLKPRYAEVIIVRPIIRQVQNSDRINSDRLIRVGSTRINPDRPGSTRIDLNFNTIKEKGCLIKEKGYFYAFMDQQS